MDIVFIKGLQINSTIGVFDWEKTIKQLLVFDVSLGCDIRDAAKNDDLTKTLDYAAISQEIETFCQANTVELLETLAERLAQHLISLYHLPWIKLTINKPTAVENAASVGVTIERGTKK